jgi:hypothetical protein
VLHIYIVFYARTASPVARPKSLRFPNLKNLPLSDVVYAPLVREPLRPLPPFPPPPPKTGGNNGGRSGVNTLTRVFVPTLGLTGTLGITGTLVNTDVPINGLTLTRVDGDTAVRVLVPTDVRVVVPTLVLVCALTLKYD